MVSGERKSLAIPQLTGPTPVVTMYLKVPVNTHTHAGGGAGELTSVSPHALPLTYTPTIQIFFFKEMCLG